MQAIINEGHPTYGHQCYSKALAAAAGYPVGDVREPLTTFKALGREGEERVAQLTAIMRELDGADGRARRQAAAGGGIALTPQLFTPLRVARPRAAQPDRGLADVPVLGGRRRRAGLASAVTTPGSPWAASAPPSSRPRRSPATAASPMAAPVCGRTARSTGWRGSPPCIASTASRPASSSAMPAAAPAPPGRGRAAQPLALDGPDPAWPTVGPSARARARGLPGPARADASPRSRLWSTASGAAVRTRTARRLRRRRDPRRPWLSHPFLLLAVSNRREDAFGGSLERRMRLPLLVAEAVRAAWPAELPAVLPRLVGRRRGRRGHDRGHGGAGAGAQGSAASTSIDCSSGGMSGSGHACRRARSARATRCPTPRRCGRGRYRHHGRGCDHLAGAGRVRSLAEGRPTWSRWAASCLADPNWPLPRCLRAGSGTALAGAAGKKFAVLPRAPSGGAGGLIKPSQLAT